ncbi:MAG: hypothetical protein LBJ42_00005, partial [Holosporales bacterium]|nr:hypothetical protein [Holosporales bacterium]
MVGLRGKLKTYSSRFMLKRLVYAAFAACMLIATGHTIKIEIAGGNVEPEPIAVVGPGEVGNSELDGIAQIIRNDLELSGLFRIVDHSCDACTIKTDGSSQHSTNGGARYLLKMNNPREGTLTDMITGKVLLKISTTVSDSRRAAHDIADTAFKRITNEDGFFNTHIAYVETVPGLSSTRRRTRIVLVDQDGFNRMQLTDGKRLDLTPRASFDGRYIAYASIDDNARNRTRRAASAQIIDVRARSVRQVIDGRMLAELSRVNGGRPVQMSYAPRLSPDGSRAVLAIIIGGHSAICEVNFMTGKIRRLTELHGIDTSPSYLQDGRILFTSDRDGQEAVYRMEADGSNVERLSRGDGKYSQPAQSPRGDLIAFTKQYKGRFFIGVMKTDGTGERLIASGDVVEAPTWAPNG